MDRAVEAAAAALDVDAGDGGVCLPREDEALGEAVAPHLAEGSGAADDRRSLKAEDAGEEINRECGETKQHG